MKPPSWKILVELCLRCRYCGVDDIISFRVQAAGANIVGPQDTPRSTSMLEFVLMPFRWLSLGIRICLKSVLISVSDPAYSSSFLGLWSLRAYYLTVYTRLKCTLFFFVQWLAKNSKSIERTLT